MNIPFMFDGINFRLIQGNKTTKKDGSTNGDRILQWETPTGWRNITMRTMAIIATIWGGIEDQLYPQSMGFQGREKLIQYLTEHINGNHREAEKEAQFKMR